MKKMISLLLFCTCLFAIAEDEEIPTLDSDEELIEHCDSIEIRSPPLSKDGGGKMRTKGTPLAPKLEGIILLSPRSAAFSPPRLRGVQSFAPIPGDFRELRTKLKKYINDRPLTMGKIDAVRKEIILFYQRQNRPLMTVQIPEQDISDGTLKLILIESRVDDVLFKGNRWFADSLFARNITLEYTDDPIELDVLLDDIAWLNKNPFRISDIVFTKGSREGTTNIEVVTQDRFPMRVYLGGDNTGTEVTGKGRWFTGVDWGYAFMLNQMFSYQFTTGYSVKDFQAHTIHYTAFIPDVKHILSIFGGFSYADSEIPEFEASGYSGQASLRYDIPFKPLYSYFLKEAHVGFDYKIINNPLLFIGTVSNPERQLENGGLLNLFQMVGGFTLAWDVPRHKVSFNWLLYWSPGTWLPHQTADKYNRFRENATPHYVYTRPRLDYTYTREFFSLSLSGRAQISSSTLIQSEQLALGGFDTVRGYDERAYLADNGVITNVEIRSPILHPLNWIYPKVHDDLIFLAFWDFGYGVNNRRIQLEIKDEVLMGVGPALRYSIGRYLSGRAAYGFKLHDIRGDQARGRWHLGLIVNY